MFIVFEGIDGTGKSTQAKRLAAALRTSGRDVVLSKEPTDGPIGTRLRSSAETGRLSPQEELDLFIEDRRQHVETLILPSLQAQKTVILDRYYFSTMAYQGIRGFDPLEIRKLNEAFAPQPDLVLLLELPIEDSLARIGVRDGHTNQFEQRDFLEQCHEIFSSLEDPFIERLEATSSPEVLHQNILAKVQERLPDQRHHCASDPSPRH